MQQVTVSGYSGGFFIPPNATNYNTINGQGPWQAAELDACQVVSTPGTIDRFYIETTGAPGVGEQWQFWIRVNGATPPGTPTVTIAGGATSGSDLVNSVAVAAGDYIDIMCTASAAAANFRSMRHTIRFTGTQARESLIPGCSMAALDAAAIRCTFVANAGVTWLVIGAIAFRQNTIPTNGTIKNLYVRLSQTPGVAPDGYRFTLMVNGIATAITCTVTAPATTASDLVNSVVLAPYDRIAMRCEPLNGPANTPTGHWGFAFVANVDGESLLLSAVDDDLDQVNVEYVAPNATQSSWVVGEGNVYQLGQESVLRKLHVILSAAPGVGASHTLTTRHNVGDTLLAVTIAGAATQGNDMVNSANILNSSEITMKSSHVNNPAVSIAYFGMVGYIAPLAAAPPCGSLAGRMIAAKLI